MEKLKNKLVSFLRWTEKYTKTDMVYLARGGFWTVSSQIVLSFVIFLMAVSYAHFLPKEAYGEYKFILSIATILGTFTLSGLNIGTLRSISLGYEGTLRYAFWQNIKWSALFFLGSGAVAGYYFLQGNYSIAVAMLFVGCLSPILNSSNLYSSYLAAKKDFRRNALYFDIIGNFFPYACLFTTMLLTSEPAWLVIVYFASNTLIGLVLYRRVLKIYKPNKSIDKEMLNYSKHLSLMDILSGIANNIDQILVFHYIGAAELAIYNFAIAIPNQIKGPVKNLTGLMFPKFAKRSDKEIRASMKSKLLLLFLASFAIVIVYVILAPFIFKIFFPKYLDAVLYSQIFSFSILVITFTPANVYLSAKKKIREQYIVNISSSIVQIVLVCVSIILWGLMGLIITRVIVRLFTNIIIMFLYSKSVEEL